MRPAVAAAAGQQRGLRRLGGRRVEAAEGVAGPGRYRPAGADGRRGAGGGFAGQRGLLERDSGGWAPGGASVVRKVRGKRHNATEGEQVWSQAFPYFTRKAEFRHKEWTHSARRGSTGTRADRPAGGRGAANGRRARERTGWCASSGARGRGSAPGGRARGAGRRRAGRWWRSRGTGRRRARRRGDPWVPVGLGPGGRSVRAGVRGPVGRVSPGGRSVGAGGCAASRGRVPPGGPVGLDAREGQGVRWGRPAG